jgi:hypothetical protein
MAEHEHDPALERRNLNLGLALFGLFVLLFGLMFVVAFIYLALS